MIEVLPDAVAPDLLVLGGQLHLHLAVLSFHVLGQVEACVRVRLPIKLQKTTGKLGQTLTNLGSRPLFLAVIQFWILLISPGPFVFQRYLGGKKKKRLVLSNSLQTRVYFERPSFRKTVMGTKEDSDGTKAFLPARSQSDGLTKSRWATLDVFPHTLHGRERDTSLEVLSKNTSNHPTSRTDNHQRPRQGHVCYQNVQFMPRKKHAKDTTANKIPKGTWQLQALLLSVLLHRKQNSPRPSQRPLSYQARVNPTASNQTMRASEFSSA